MFIHKYLNPRKIKTPHFVGFDDIFIFPNLTYTNTSYYWCMGEGNLDK
jgi:hypothetical protein